MAYVPEEIEVSISGLWETLPPVRGAPMVPDLAEAPHPRAATRGRPYNLSEFHVPLGTGQGEPDTGFLSLADVHLEAGRLQGFS